MREPLYPLIEYLRPLMVTRLVNTHDRWVERLDAYQFQPHGINASPLIEEAQEWVGRTAYLQMNLSPEQIIAAVERLPKRELQILEGRSQGRVYKELAYELGISITRVRTLYLKGIKRCFQYILETSVPDQDEAETLVKTLPVVPMEDLTLNGKLRQIWRITEAILAQRLGRGSHMALQRLKVEIVANNPEVLAAEIEHWLKHNFSEMTAEQFVKALK